MDFEEQDQWTAADLLRHLRYEGGRLVCETDYVRGRMMKTDVTVFPDGRFTLTTTNRGVAASRWVAQLQGKKVLRPVPPAGESEPGEGGRKSVPATASSSSRGGRSPGRVAAMSHSARSQRLL